MDWELYERQRATLTFIGVAVISFLLLAFQRTFAVQHIRAFFVGCTVPAQRMFSHWAAVPATEKPPESPVLTVENASATPEVPDAIEGHAEKFRALRILAEENAHLNSILNLKRARWPRLLAAHIVGRDPQKWFQEALLDKGAEDGVHVDDPVIGVKETREAVIGRIVEVGTHTSRIMLINDSLSAIPAVVVGDAHEDGVVEGSNSNDLYLKYLIRDSQVKIGDLVVTSGLGGIFPQGIPIGWVQEIGLDSRQLFLQAKLKPASVSFPSRIVGVLMEKE